MQISINKAKLTVVAIALVLLMASVTLIVDIPVQPTRAQEPVEPISGPLPAGVTPSVTTDTTAHLSFRPNLVGVGQTFLVNLWVTPALHRSRYHPDYTVTITDPDGNEDVIVMDSYHADATAWFEYVADQVGEWKLKFDFLGTYFPPANVTGGWMEPPLVLLDSAYYNPSSSPELTLTVQEDFVYSWPPSPLPTDYWTRPAHVEHREWWPILGSFPGTGYVGTSDPEWDTRYPDTNPHWSDRYRFTPWVQGPNTAHIVWKEQYGIAGLIGGQAQKYGTTMMAANPSIVYAGRAYQVVTAPGGAQIWQCYDLRTGELYWENPVTATTVMTPFGPMTSTLTPEIVEYASPTQSEVPGAEAAGTWMVSLIYIGGGRLYKWDPWTGAMTTNVSIAPLDSGTYYRNSEGRDSDPCALTVQDLSPYGPPLPADQRYRLINWTTRSGGYGSPIVDTDFTTRILSNTTYARSNLPSLIDYNAGLGADVSGIEVSGVYTGMNISSFDLKTGVRLWSQNISEPMYSFICDIADHGKIAVLSDRGYYVAYDLLSGDLAWKSEKMDYPWAAAGFGAYSAMSAYGMLFRESMDGIYAFNWTNGKIVWKYEAPARAAFESSYTGKDGGEVYPFYSFGVGGRIADGKFYTWTYEHTESWPVTRGWGIHCINITTGEGIWNLLGCMTPGAVADGYLTASNSYDGYTYVFGKGLSATAVTATPAVIAKGATVLIEGTVLDQSPAQPGTPCVSKESMALQMEYLHMQQPIGGLWGNETITGVLVTLVAIGSDGTVIDIGTVTTNGYYGTFSYAWTPPNEDTYEIIASFASDDSYGSSAAATAVSVGPAPEEPTEPIEPAVQEDIDRAVESLTPMFLGIIAAVIVVAILVVYTLFTVRKQRK